MGVEAEQFGMKIPLSLPQTNTTGKSDCNRDDNQHTGSQQIITSILATKL